MATLHDKYMQALKNMNKTMKQDNKDGHQWTYCNKKKQKGKNFTDARKQGKYKINCVDGPQWACLLAGVPNSALSWYGNDGIVWCSTNAKKNCKKYFDIINAKGKTVSQLLKAGLLCEGDILTYKGFAHTNAYYGGGKSFDSGHAYTKGSGEGAPFRKWIGKLVCGNRKVAYILRLKDRKHYRVQCGAFHSEAEADKYAEEYEEKGFKTVKIKEDGMIKLQAGYFSGLENAEALVAKLAKKKIPSFIKTI